MLDSIEIQEAPSVYPTLEDMSDFQKYTQQLEKLYSKDFGMVKVVAPKDYCPRKQDYTTSIEHLQIPSPIEQNLHGKGGIYECLHLIKKSLQIKEFVKRSAKIQPNIEGKTSLEVEKLFWKNASFSPPIYGADFQKSLFDQGCIWNLCELDTILKKGVSQALSGVTEPYLYVGQWKSLFAWHKEDYDLGAINYLHYGQPKFWYCVSSDNGHLLEKCAKLYFQESFTKCSEFLRHKTGIINPYIIKKKFPEIKISKIQHNPREFIIIFNGAYHHGFNFGYNIAESVNFATNSWLTEHFLKANKQCLCNKGVVRMNHMEFYDNIVKNYPELKNQPFIKKFHELLIQGGFDKQKDYLQKLLEEKQNEQIEEQQQQNTNETIINQHHHISDENSLSDSTIKKNEKEIKIISKKIDKKRVNTKKNENKEKKQQNLKNIILHKVKPKKDQDIDQKQKDVEKYEIELNQENKIILKKNQNTEIQLTKKIKKQENKHKNKLDKNSQKNNTYKKKEKQDENIRNQSEKSLQMISMDKSNDIMSEDLTDNQIQEYLPKNDYNMFQSKMNQNINGEKIDEILKYQELFPHQNQNSQHQNLNQQKLKLQLFKDEGQDSLQYLDFDKKIQQNQQILQDLQNQEKNQTLQNSTNQILNSYNYYSSNSDVKINENNQNNNNNNSIINSAQKKSQGQNLIQKVTPSKVLTESLEKLSQSQNSAEKPLQSQNIRKKSYQYSNQCQDVKVQNDQKDKIQLQTVILQELKQELSVQSDIKLNSNQKNSPNNNFTSQSLINRKNSTSTNISINSNSSYNIQNNLGQIQKPISTTTNISINNQNNNNNNNLNNFEQTNNNGKGKGKRNSGEIIENWIQCDNCMKWRRIEDKTFCKKLRRRKNFFCSYILKQCSAEEENYQQSQTISTNF